MTLSAMKRRLTPIITKAMDRLGVPGAAVGLYLDGKEQHLTFGVTNVEFPLDVDEHTMFQIGSTTKTYTGTALMMLVEEGKVDLEAPVTDYLPKFALPDKGALGEVRIRHLVTHTSGFLGDYFEDLGRGADALKRKVARMRTKTPQLTPVGAVWSYNNAGFYVLGRLIEAVTGQVYEDVIKQRILEPLGMDHTFWFPEDVITHKTALGHIRKPDGSAAVARPWGIMRAANPAGGLVSTSVDQLKYARFHLADGKTADGKRLMKAATARRMRKPLASQGWALADSVGVTWLLDKFGPVTVAKHGGSINGHMSEFVTVPAKQFALSVLTNGARGHELGTMVIKGCLASIGLERPEPTFRSLTTRAAADYTGRYPVMLGDYVVTADNGGLLLTVEPKKEVLEADPDIASMLPPPLPMGLVAKDRAVVRGDYIPGSRVEFLRDADGVVEWMRFGGRIAKRAAE
jgi:CubicO group peptidase (beta-lactamase class C family)